MFVKAVLRENRIPFEIKVDDDLFYSESNMKVLHSSIKQFEEGKIVEKVAEELRQYEND